MINIQPTYLTLNDLLTKRLFKIPKYQRAYSWQTRQRKDLFDDLNKIAQKTDEAHFMATVVGLRHPEVIRIVADEYYYVDVVDGQQRLTTLIILLKAIENAIKKNSKSSKEEIKIREDLKGLMLKSDELSLVLLQTNHDTSSYFSNYLRDGVFPNSRNMLNLTLADKALLDAMSECMSFVEDWKKNRKLVDLVILIKNRLTFIFHEILDERIVYTVFETLNSRGLDVSWLDRLKSLLMATVFESQPSNRAAIIDEVHRLWGEIYNIIGLRQGLNTEALRFAATLKLAEKPNRVLSEEASVQTLQRLSAKSEDVIKTTQWIKDVTKSVDKLWEDRRKNAISKIAHARLVATAINLRKDINDPDKKTILRRWENVTFRIFGMMRKDSRTGVGHYVRLSWHIEKNGFKAKDIIKEIDEIGSEFSPEDAVNALRNTDCYNGWEEELRYLLFRYEEYLAKQKGQNFNGAQWARIWEASSSESIEHIMPQSGNDENLVHRLGNLILLPPGLNSSLGSKTPKAKKGEYKNSGLFMVQDVVSQLSRWGENTIAEREKKILDWAVQEWA